MLRSVRVLFWLFGLLAVCSVPQAQAQLKYPLSIAVADSGVMYLADLEMHGVWKIEGEKLSPYFEGSPRFRTPLTAVRCVAIDRDGKLLAGDSSTREIYRFDDTGKPIGLTHIPTPAATPPAATPPDDKKSDDKKSDDKPAEKEGVAGGPAAAAPTVTGEKQPSPAPPRAKFIFGEIGIPMDIAVDKAGDLFVSDLEIHRIVKIAKGGGAVHEFVQIQAPRGLCFDADENLWVVSGRKLVRVSPAGEKTTVVEEGILNFPHTVAVAADKTAYVTDGYEKCIWKIPQGGKPEKLVSGEPLVNPVGMRLVGHTLWVVDPRAKAVFKITVDGQLTKLAFNP